MIKIGIIGAMELEVDTLKQTMDLKNSIKKASMEFWEGSLCGIDVVVVRSGICKVNAGICAHILADSFHVTHIINTGVAGSLDPVLNIGDIVLSTDALYHDVDATIFGYQPGEVPQLGRLAFTADPALIQAAEQSCRSVNPDISVYKGRVVSGDQFISSKETKHRLVDVFHGMCTEMEGAAIAQAAVLNDVPFVIIRAISDKADETAELDYPTFERQAAEHCAKLVQHMLPLIS